MKKEDKEDEEEEEREEGGGMEVRLLMLCVAGAKGSHRAGASVSLCSPRGSGAS